MRAAFVLAQRECVGADAQHAHRHAVVAAGDAVSLVAAHSITLARSSVSSCSNSAPIATSRSSVAVASASSITEIAKPTWIRTQSPGPRSSKRPMLTVRRTPATSTRASWLDSSTTSRIWPGMARHTSSRSPLGRPGTDRDRVVSLLNPARDLSRIEEAVWIQSGLDGAHHGYSRRAVLELQERRFAVADAMLPGTGSFSGDRPPHQAVVEIDGALQLVLVVRIDEDREV